VNTDELEALVGKLRTLGVTHYKTADLELDLSATVPLPPAEDKKLTEEEFEMWMARNEEAVQFAHVEPLSHKVLVQ
jgi:hypothetical protein